MSAALTLAQRGVKVTLFEKSDKLGGLVNQAKEPPLKGNMKWLAEYYGEEFKNCGVDVRLGTEATPEIIDGVHPDAVVIATGGSSVVPGLPGVNGKNVFTVADVLTGKAGLTGKEIVLIGAGMKLSVISASTQAAVKPFCTADSFRASAKESSTSCLTETLKEILSCAPNLLFHSVLWRTLSVMLAFVSGLILLLQNRKKAVLLPAEKQLPEGTAFRTAWLNTGMLVFSVLSLALIVYSAINK